MSTPKTESVGSSSSISDLSATQDQPLIPRREKSKRPQLSCNDCRARKVKCDRLQPCTACSLHQIAESCHYELTEAERQPILQAEAIKLKDKEIARLRQENHLLRAQSIYSAQQPLDGEHLRLEKGGLGSVIEDSKGSLSPCKRPREADHQGSIYFGAPCSASVVKELADLSFDSKATNLAHGATPSFTSHMDASFPFPTLWHAQHGTCRLVDLLPNKIDLLSLLRAFEHHAPLGYFPYVPEECTERGVDRFLANVERHSLLHPDILALLFAALAQGVQSGLYGRCGGKWVPGAMHREVKKGDVFIAAAMHSLRIAAFLSRPTIPVVETLVMIGPYLINSGKYLDAWSLFGITVRLAQRIGLHQDPSQLNPPVSLAEVITRRKLWWWILHMDHHHSQAIGRPLAISSVGDCPSTSTLAHDAVVHGLEVYNARFTILARQTLTAGTLCNAQLDDYIHQLSSLPETLPDCLRFKEDWLDEGTLIPQWPIDVQAAFLYSQKHHLLAWLHRKRVDAISLESSDSTIDLFVSPASAPSNHTLYGREQVLESSRSILRVLGFFHTRERAAMICWTVGQQAFNAAWILLTSMLETRITMDVGILQQAYSIFVEMQSLGIHSLASGAVEKLRGLMDRCSTGATAGEFMVSSHAMILLEDPGSHIFGQGVVVPVACHGTSSPTPQTGQSNGGAAIAHGQKDLTVSIASSKKQKTTVNKSGARSKVTEKKSTVEQRRSSVPQRRYSGLWMKEERPAKPSLERNKNSSSQPPGLAHQGVQIVRPGSQGTNLRSSDTAGHSDIYGDATAFQSCRPFTSHNGPPYEHLGTTWTPFQMYTAAHTSAPPHERAIQMHRNYSNSYSEHSSDKPGNSQSSTQLSSPVQSHSFHGSPHSPQSQILPHDLYEHSFFGLTSVQAQAGTPALAPSVPSSYQVPDAPALTWQLSATGFHGDRQHLAPNSSL